jgi:hypothetical protein
MILSITLGVILSVGSDHAIMHQVQQLALSKVQATVSRAIQSLNRMLGQWIEQGADVVLKEIAQLFKDG